MKTILHSILLFFLILTSSTLSEVIYFGSSVIYDGEVKKGKAHGIGTFTFADGTKYEGKFSKNRFHGKGKYTDIEGNVFEGKWKYGKFTNKIDPYTREVIQLSVAVGKTNHFEIRGPGHLSNKWFEAELKEVNSKSIQQVKELDIFDTPSVFSADYGDEKKINELLELKNAEINATNNKTASISENVKTVFILTEKGKRDQTKAEKVMARAEVKETHTAMSSSSSSSSDDSGDDDSGGGGPC
tara:strand:- start:576 stop:1301 length:726 start_codon:yes stop_codon:yes gene_type:complete